MPRHSKSPPGRHRERSPQPDAAESLPERILALLRQPDYQPLEKVGISKALQISSSERREVSDALRGLEESGRVARIRKDYYILPKEADLIAGTIEVHRNGHAHLLPEDKEQRDISIFAENLGTAMHGDKVLARLNTDGRGRRGGDDRLSGQVIRVLHRGTHRVVGLLQQSPRQLLHVVPDDPRFRHHVYVKPGETALPQIPRPGDKVVVELAPWEDPRESPEGEIVEVLGPADAPGIDMLSIVRKYGLQTEFPEEVVREAEGISESVHPEEIERREDLRDELIFTIDPDDARDFDDAIHLRQIKDRRGEVTGWHVGIHIADVSHYVQPGTALDREAHRRGNSTYLVDRVIPMLPERLSNGICSLKPGVERLAFSAFLEINRAGHVKAARFGKTVIRSAARLSYRQALAILEGQNVVPPLPPSMERETRGVATFAEGPPVAINPAVADAVRAAWDLAAILRKNRFENGSLDLDFPEVKIWLDAEGKAVRLEKQLNDISHQLIEEYMLAANEAVALELKQRSVPAVYRVHEDPDPERLADFRENVRVFGVKAGDLTQRREVQRVLKDIKGLPEEYALKLQFLKSLKRAAYGVDPLGHYGLAKVNYTHFTSPIRRYADLLVHRGVERAVSLVAPPPGHRPRRPVTGASMGELKSIAEHISATERVSADAEKDSVQLKKIEYFQRQLASKKPDEYRAIVIEVRAFGLIVELPDVLMTGLIHVTALPDDFYIFDSVRMAFTGRRTQRRYALGDMISVIVERVDPIKRQVDFAPVGTLESPRKTAPRFKEQGRPRPEHPRQDRGKHRQAPQARRGERESSGPKRGDQKPAPRGASQRPPQQQRRRPQNPQQPRAAQPQQQQQQPQKRRRR